MPIRFHRQFTLFPGVKVNVSKTGMSITVGGKGFHLNFSRRGVMQTTNLPGKGLSHRSYLFKKDPDEEDDKPEAKERSEEKSEDKPKRKRARDAQEQSSSPWGFFVFVLIALFFIYFGGSALGLIPPNLVTDFLSTLTQWARQVGL
jgi:hypothetical protein